MVFKLSIYSIPELEKDANELWSKLFRVLNIVINFLSKMFHIRSTLFQRTKSMLKFLMFKTLFTVSMFLFANAQSIELFGYKLYGTFLGMKMMVV